MELPTSSLPILPPFIFSWLELLPTCPTAWNEVVDVLWKENQRLQNKNQELCGEIEELTARLKLELKKRFGASSEHAKAPQSVATPDGGQEEPVAAETTTPPEMPVPNPRGGQYGHPGHGRNMAPAALLREERNHDIPEAEKRCPECGKPYEEAGFTEDSEEIDVRIQVVVVHHKRKVYCPTCSCPTDADLIIAPVPPKLIPKGKFSVQTWTKFLLDKYLA